MGKFKEEPKQGPPAYLVSFGDMMTLVLTFFILLVSMSQEQRYGLLAKGVGSFIVAIQSHGLNGVLSAEEKMAVFEHMRRRFNLPPEEEPERRTDFADASSKELLRTRVLEALQPHSELHYPLVAVFEPGSTTLSQAGRRYLDELAPSLRPRFSQLLLLEGHASLVEDGPESVPIAFGRAQAVRRYLIETHDFQPQRVEARAWRREVQTRGAVVRAVDARLVTPPRPPVSPR